MKRTMLHATLALVGTVALIAVGAAGGAATKKGKPKLSATPVFKLHLKPSQEVPPIKHLRAAAFGALPSAPGRRAAGATTPGE